jgi:hypothetical protein
MFGFFMFCLLCILIIFVMKTHLMRYLSLIYFIKQPLHVLGIFIAHHQEVFTVYVQQLVCVIRLGDWQLVGSGQVILYIYSEYLLMMCTKYP